ncbi:hypothetical protein K402DRAFT_80488 [Aulographum hederae CBS 113979]|uniref:Uncharacterized protein n=1 Tax=Aulographum hederae CBS 113979 TaxID=1176131 RepID=A0A6G1HGK2_9PEZI|nr:hypothetical protein K402DRAFT_80488 [Aulographum hederae CBS 113979]
MRISPPLRLLCTLLLLPFTIPISLTNRILTPLATLLRPPVTLLLSLFILLSLCCLTAFLSIFFLLKLSTWRFTGDANVSLLAEVVLVNLTIVVPAEWGEYFAKNWNGTGGKWDKGGDEDANRNDGEGEDGLKIVGLIDAAPLVPRAESVAERMEGWVDWPTATETADVTEAPVNEKCRMREQLSRVDGKDEFLGEHCD